MLVLAVLLLGKHTLWLNQYSKGLNDTPRCPKFNRQTEFTKLILRYSSVKRRNVFHHRLLMCKHR